MSTFQVRKLFIFVLIFLPLQYVLVGIIGSLQSEPWPAFVFPGFKNVYVYEDGYELRDVIFEIHQESEEEPVRLSSLRIFPEIPPSQISGFVRTHFSTPDQVNHLNEESKKWLIRHAERFADQPVTDIRISWVRNYYSKPAIHATPDSTSVTTHFSLLKQQGGEDE